MKRLQALLYIALATFAGSAIADGPTPIADYLFVGSYHMNNPGRDVHNTRADDVLSPGRQREIAEVVRLLARYRPTRIVIERDAGKQGDLDAQYAQTCAGTRAYTRREDEQIGFRLACRLKLPPPVAVDWSELGPIKDEDSIHYPKAIEKYGQQVQRAADLAIGEAENKQGQAILDRGSVGHMLRHLNAPAWRAANARSYYRVAQYGTPADPVGANWEALWYLRNRMIANHIARATRPGDRVLVLYGAGHGNWLQQHAAESGLYRMHDPLRWLDPAEPTQATR